LLGKFNVLIDFNKVNFQSLNYKNLNGITNYSFDCDGKCMTFTPLDKELELLGNMIKNLYPKGELISPLQSTKTRFEKALNDFVKICPGHISKY